MSSSLLQIGFIGYGAVSQDVTHLLTERSLTDMVVIGALVRHPEYSRPVGSPKIVTTLAAFLAEKPDVVVEAAGYEGLREFGPAILREGIDLILVSVGTLADTNFLDDLLKTAQQSGARIKVASGAIGALDALAAASLGGFSTVIHTMRKPPEALLPPEECIHLTGAQEIFRGNARQAVVTFPAFLNVAAAVALTGIGFDRTEVRVMADPSVRNSVHEVQAEGAFGSLRCTIEHLPISAYGRGARLVAMSIVHNLLLHHAVLMIG